jgi:4a-hydroxytetrahydrobiopterin dehydratase
MAAVLLTGDERQALLPALGETGWGAVDGRDAIRKVWKFRNFSEAWGFMSRAALAAEVANHHPEWTNRFNIVDVTLVTHDCAGLSMLDVTLARQFDRLAGTASVVGDVTQPIACLCEERAGRASGL